MGQKVHPYGFRLGVIRDWQSRWFADKEYKEFAVEDHKIRTFLRQRLPGLLNANNNRRGARGSGGDAGVSNIEIERMANMIKVTLHTSRPGVIIGRGGKGIEDLKNELEKIVPRKVQLNVLEIKTPELDAQLVADSIASQIERRVSFKRATRLAIARTMQRGGKGIKVLVAGRLGGAEIARGYGDKDGKIPLHTLRADIDYGTSTARTQYGQIGVKVWIYRGEILSGYVGAPAAQAQRDSRPQRSRRDRDSAPSKGWKRVEKSAPVAENAPVEAAPVETTSEA